MPDGEGSGQPRLETYGWDGPGTSEGACEPALLHPWIDHAPHAIAITQGPLHVIRRVNPAFCRLLGVAAEDVLDRPCAKAIPGPAGEGLLPLLARVFASGEAELDRTVARAGTTAEGAMWSFTVWPLQPPTGPAYGLVVEVRDQTMEMELARRLREMAEESRDVNERLLRSALREQEWAEEVEAARSALERANLELERRVAERTADLERTNAALTVEIAERERAEQARTELLRQLVTAVEDERRRISRELHDQLGQQITGLSLGLRGLRGINARHQSRKLEELEGLASRVAADVQHLALEMRPPALDNLGLVAALQDHLEEWGERHGVETDFHAMGMGGVPLPPEIATTLYRTVQEGLTNVLKHAGATRVSLVLERRRGEVRAILEDNGGGFDVERILASPEKARRLGVRGIRERLALLGGTLEIESVAGSGSTLFVRVPAPPATDGAA